MFSVHKYYLQYTNEFQYGKLHRIDRVINVASHNNDLSEMPIHENAIYVQKDMIYGKLLWIHSYEVCITFAIDNIYKHTAVYNLLQSIEDLRLGYKQTIELLLVELLNICCATAVLY